MGRELRRLEEEKEKEGGQENGEDKKEGEG